PNSSTCKPTSWSRSGVPLRRALRHRPRSRSTMLRAGCKSCSAASWRRERRELRDRPMTDPAVPGREAEFPFYRGPQGADQAVARRTTPALIRSVSRAALDDPARYRPHPDLAAAVNTALLLGLPLLVTGEPGSGKTQLGEAVAHALGLGHAKYETKSTSQARDVFYEFDVVGRFHARETG